jgi:hypothetical protein
VDFLGVGLDRIPKSRPERSTRVSRSMRQTHGDNETT